MSDREKRAVEMRILLARWQKSGLSLAEFGKREGVSYNTLTYWRRRELGAKEPSRRKKRPARKAAGSLAPVSVVGESGPRSNGFDVRLRNGVEVGIQPGFRPDELARVLELAGQC